ncbi:histidine kinase [Ruminococcus sp. 5_1_39BFAA]|uniref:sensor histidine kinase n=1 Tax=Ruminococcus sp. 5_1_39BFAA TaxID=457412 RepID=UPI003569392A
MTPKLKQRYKDMSIRKKIIILFMAVFLFFIILVLASSNVILYHSNITKIERTIQDECDMINLQISNLYDSLKICQSSTIQGINQVYQEREIDETDQVSIISIKNSLRTVLSYYKSCISVVNSLVFVDNNNNVVSVGLKNEPNKKDLEELLVQIPPVGPISSITFPIENREFLGGSEREGILTQGVRVISIETGETLGYLFINIKSSAIAELFPDNKDIAYRKNYYIVDDRNKVVVTRNTEGILKEEDPSFIKKINQFGEESFQSVVNEEKCLITTRENSKFGWTIINEIPIHDIMKDIYLMTIMIVLIGIACIVLSVIFILILSRVITNPIKALTDTASIISAGDLSCRCVVDCRDEVGVLSKTFNKMLERIQNLLQQVKEEQKRKRETELALFQIQIKPHFLYNTLDLIYVCCEMDDGKTGGRIAKALADYYRTCLSGGSEVISIGEELRNTENYLYIQKERYSDIITYHMSAAENCLKYKIPKMTLQPLVENAIYHGLKEKEEGGCISIEVMESEEFVIVEVIDDGIGMEPEIFDSILEKKDERGKKHFGLKNVHERLQLYFGEEYGLSIDKEKKTGTCIRIRIPKIEAYYD